MTLLVCMPPPSPLFLRIAARHRAHFLPNCHHLKTPGVVAPLITKQAAGIKQATSAQRCAPSKQAARAARWMAWHMSVKGYEYDPYGQIVLHKYKDGMSYGCPLYAS